MSTPVVLMCLHGMGDTDPDYHAGLFDALADRMGSSDWAHVHREPIYYQDIFQQAQEALFERVRHKVDSRKLRKLLLYGFADAGALEHSRAGRHGAYARVQQRIFDAAGRAHEALGRRRVPVVMVAQSLGGHVFSNYLWDAQHHRQRPTGIWRGDHAALSPAQLSFRKFASLRLLLTTGCNIPLFVGGLPVAKIKPVKAPNTRFVWENCYDEDDPLGWPLGELSPAYRALVRDRAVNSGSLLTSWNPLSHSRYWEDDEVLDPLAERLRQIIAGD